MTCTEQTTRPFNLTRKAFKSCADGCDKPGLSHPNHDPYDVNCGDCAIFCTPCTFIIDSITLPLFFIHKCRQALKFGTDENQNSG